MTAARQYLRADEIKRLTGVSLRTVRRWIADKKLPSVKLASMVHLAQESDGGAPVWGAVRKKFARSAKVVAGGEQPPKIKALAPRFQGFAPDDLNRAMS